MLLNGSRPTKLNCVDVSRATGLELNDFFIGWRVTTRSLRFRDGLKSPCGCAGPAGASGGIVLLIWTLRKPWFHEQSTIIGGMLAAKCFLPVMTP